MCLRKTFGLVTKKEKDGQWEASLFVLFMKYEGESTEQIKERTAMTISMIRRDETWIQNFAWERNHLRKMDA